MKIGVRRARVALGDGQTSSIDSDGVASSSVIVPTPCVVGDRRVDRARELDRKVSLASSSGVAVDEHRHDAASSGRARTSACPVVGCSRPAPWPCRWRSRSRRVTGRPLGALRLTVKVAVDRAGVALGDRDVVRPRRSAARRRR